jgi:hypothetical protein
VGLTRTATGLLFRDDFNRANSVLPGVATNWERFGGATADADWNIVGNEVQMNLVGSPQTDMTAKPSTWNGDLVVQSTWRRSPGNGRSGLGMCAPDGQTANILILRDPSNGWEMWHHPRAGGFTLAATSGAFLTDGSTLKLFRRTAPGRIMAWSAGNLIFDLANATTLLTESLRGAMTHCLNSVAYDNFVCCKGNKITCIGMEPGTKLRCGGIDAVEVAGTATIDFGNATFPLPNAQIVSAANVVLDTLTVEVFGGDTFAWSAIPAIWQPTDLAVNTAWIPMTDPFAMRTRGWRLVPATYAQAAVHNFNSTPEAEWYEAIPFLDFRDVLGTVNFIALLHELTLIPQTKEVYTLEVAYDDGVRLYVDGVKVFDNFGDGFGSFTVALDFTNGRPKVIRVEQVQGPGVQHFGLYWSSASIARVPVPATQCRAPVTWVGEVKPVTAWGVA